MEREVVREELTASVSKNRDELFRLRRERARLLNAAAGGPGTAEGLEALRTADEVGSRLLQALDAYEQSLTRLSAFARMAGKVRHTKFAEV